jgi:hypothetical protein
MRFMIFYLLPEWQNCGGTEGKLAAAASVPPGFVNVGETRLALDPVTWRSVSKIHS